MKFFLTALFALFACACETVPAHAEPVSFSLQDVNNENTVLDLDTYMGSKVVVEFYFADCSACRQNAPKFRSMFDAHGAHAKFIEVSIDCNDADYRYWLREHSPDWPVLNDCGDNVADMLRVSSFPTTLVLDEQHNVLYRTSGVWSSSVRRRIEREIMGDHK